MSQGNNSVPFCEKRIGPGEFFNHVIETLSIIIDRHPKGKPRKRES